MKYKLIYIENETERTKEFDSIWDALREAIRMLESDIQIKGIVCGENLFKQPNYVLRSAAIHMIWLSLANCPVGYWEE